MRTLARVVSFLLLCALPCLAQTPTPQLTPSTRNTVHTVEGILVQNATAAAFTTGGICAHDGHKTLKAEQTGAADLDALCEVVAGRTPVPLPTPVIPGLWEFDAWCDLVRLRVANNDGRVSAYFFSTGIPCQ